MSIQFSKECEYCGCTAWCGLLGDRWHCGCQFQKKEESVN